MTPTSVSSRNGQSATDVPARPSGHPGPLRATTSPGPGERPEETLAGTWQLDPTRSSVAFETRLLWGLATVSGHFDAYRGRLDLDTDPAIELTIDAASVQTGNPKRDRHLRSADFFDADNHRQVRFLSDAVVVQHDTLNVRGRLSVRDQSIPLALDVHVRRVDGELAIEAATSAPHRELGMSWNPLRMIRPRSALLVRGYLVPNTE